VGPVDDSGGLLYAGKSNWPLLRHGYAALHSESLQTGDID